MKKKQKTSKKQAKNKKTKSKQKAHNKSKKKAQNLLVTLYMFQIVCVPVQLDRMNHSHLLQIQLNQRTEINYLLPVFPKKQNK